MPPSVTLQDVFLHLSLSSWIELPWRAETTFALVVLDLVSSKSRSLKYREEETELCLELV